MKKQQAGGRRIWKIAACVLLIAAVVGGILVYRRLTRRNFGRATTVESRSLHFSDGDAAVRLTKQTRNDGKSTLLRQVWTLPNGDSVINGRMECGAKEDCDYCVLERWTLSGGEGTVVWLDAESNEWQEAPLGELTVSSNCILIDTPTTDLYFWRPISFHCLENGSLREAGSCGWVRIGKNGREVTLHSAYLSPGQVCDYTVVRSEAEGKLLDLDYKSLRRVWKNYAQNGVDRWCFDGYYLNAPENYVPTDCLYRCPAAYLVKSMVYMQHESRVGDDLSRMMLDVMSRQQCKAGYVPTPSESLWLHEDYGLDAGFFDTRFNVELVQLFCRSYAHCGGFEEFLQRWAEYYCAYAEARHYETENGGWLVWDYGAAALDTPKTHCSLNHQLAEIRTLLELDACLDDARLLPLAERLLLGIEDCGTDWLREDGNLHYAYYPDGSFGGVDYPYLTYNDLYDLQKTLAEAGKPESALLTELMASKREWMDANGITEYKK